jgi:hypothetical protein
MNPYQVSELIHTLCRLGSDDALAEVADDIDLFSAPGPRFTRETSYVVQAQIVLHGLYLRLSKYERTESFDFIFLQALRSIDIADAHFGNIFFVGEVCEELFGDDDYFPARPEDWSEFARLARRLGSRMAAYTQQVEPDAEWVAPNGTVKKGLKAIKAFAEKLESEIAKREIPKRRPASRPKRKTTTKRSPKKKSKRRKTP